MPDPRSIGRRRFLRESTVLAGALGTFGFAGRDRDGLWFAPEDDPPATHNMLVFGEETVWLSHLPMFAGLNAGKTDFTSPHRYQVILEARFGDDADQTEAYRQDRRAHRDVAIYTLGPERFVLGGLFSPPSSPGRDRFTATVFRGHLENGGTPVPGLSNVAVRIQRVVHGRPFSPSAAKPDSLEYLLVGRGAERFLVHAIFGPPDFDHVLAVEITGTEFTDRDLLQEHRVIVTDRRNTAAERLRPSEEVDATLRLAGSGAETRVRLRPTRLIYFEEGELLVPPTFDPTAEEKKG